MLNSATPVSPIAATRLKPVAARLTSGELRHWQDRNLQATIPHCIEQVSARGYVANLERMRTGEQVPFQGFVFSDSDVHKLIEAIAWTPQGEPGRDEFFSRMSGLFCDVQDPDGYLNSAFQGWDATQARWSDFPQGHELYTLGHLVQAGIAARRNGRGAELLGVATRGADLAFRLYGGSENVEVPGHQEIEMALVELYRETANRDYLVFAKRLIDRRGHGWLGGKPHGPFYYQDSFPLRQTGALYGHAVRAAYYGAGATDVAIETEDQELLQHLELLWEDLVDTKIYLTGATGSRHRDESIGDSYELPSDRAYAETCAAIGVVQWSWRLLLATGKERYAALIERVLFNGFASALSEDGKAFFYANPLQLRPDHMQVQEEGAGRRLPWYAVSCCPPNIARTMATLHNYLATHDDSGIQIHLPAAATIEHGQGPARRALTIESDYPWQASISLTITETSDEPWVLSLRVPTGWEGILIDGKPAALTNGYIRLERSWKAGDTILVEAHLPVRQVFPHHAIDALRGSSAIMRGPVVYCAESIDNEASLDDHLLSLEAAQSASSDPRGHRISIPAELAPAAEASAYRTHPPDRSYRPATLTLVPYHQWGNRDADAMRVWIPTAGSR